ncbi:coiled-coil domain-containing protein 169 isoform X1 [Petromyzon marinus]|uniref:coiled-coil domain-containing protein 169 isoform X1 n=1 Tax=Petromyzon marinus TaxID=7757 RepID=UPI003F709193
MEASGSEPEEERKSLGAEIAQQRQMKMMLEISIKELQKTAIEMEKRLGQVEEEGCEWRTRYETQRELNERLRLQLEEMRTKVKEGRDTLRERMNVMQGYNQQSKESLKQLLWKKEEERQSLQETLVDYEWRIAQEAKAYHKVINEKREVLNQLGETLDISTRQKKVKPATGPHDLERFKRKGRPSQEVDHEPTDSRGTWLPQLPAGALPRRAHGVTTQQQHRQQTTSEAQQGPTRRRPHGDQLPKLGKFQSPVIL